MAGVLNRSIQETPFAIIDLETTGLNAGADRVVEVAVVRKDPGGKPRLVLNTLVNPHRLMSATEIHGITDDDVHDAPDFGAVSGELIRALADCVVAAYNVYFDMRFMVDEFARIGLRRSVPHVCLMYLRPMLDLGPRRSLRDACGEHGIRHDNLHVAAQDATASSCLMELYLDTLRRMRVETFQQLTALSDYKFLASLHNEPLSVFSAVSLSETTAKFKPRGPVVLPSVAPEVQRQAVADYWDALTSVLADLDISEEEASQLGQKRKKLKIHSEQVRMLHARAFAGAINHFTRDQWLDESECDKLHRLHQCLDRLGWAPGKPVAANA